MIITMVFSRVLLIPSHYLHPTSPYIAHFFPSGFLSSLSEAYKPKERRKYFNKLEFLNYFYYRRIIEHVWKDKTVI